MLCAEGYVTREKQSYTTQQGYNTNFDAYSNTEKGRAAHKANLEIRLQVPQSIRQVEAQAKAVIVKREKELGACGVDVSKIPVEEREKGEGPIISAHLRWSRHINHLREKGQGDRADKAEQLLKDIFAWREKKAAELKLAPTSVLAEHTAKNIAYTRPASVEALCEIGVMLTGAEELTQIFAKFGPPPEPTQTQGGEVDCPIGLPQGAWTPPGKWEHAVYKANKGKLPPWELSYQRFMNGEHPEAIAMQQANGKSIQTSTVFSHLFDSLLYGKSLDLRRLVDAMGSRYLPTSSDWEAMEGAAAQMDLRVETAPQFEMKAILTKILDENASTRGLLEKTNEQKTEEEKELVSVWYSKIRMWSNLKRCRCPVECGEVPEAKRRRLQA